MSNSMPEGTTARYGVDRRAVTVLTGWAVEGAWRGCLTAFLLAALTLAGGVVRAQSPSGTQPASPGTTPRAAPDEARVSFADIGRRAEETAAQLRVMTESLLEQSKFDLLEKQVYGYRQRVAASWSDTDRVLGATPRRALLDALASDWRTLRSEIVALQEVVDEHAARREADLHTLDRLRELWKWNLEHAGAVAAPGPVVERIEATRSAVEATRTVIDGRHAGYLVLQDTLSRDVQACDDAVARFDEGKRRAVVRAFVRHELPIWRIRTALAEKATEGVGAAHFWEAAAASVDSVGVYTRARWPGFAATVLLTLFLMGVLARARALVATGAEASPLPASIAAVLRAPLSTAFILALVLSRTFRPDPPAALQRTLVLTAFPAALIVLRPFLDSRLVALLCTLAVLFAVDAGRGLLQTMPVADQLILILEMGAAAWIFLKLTRRLPTSPDGMAALWPRLRAAARGLVRTVAIAAAVASAAAALGYLDLADLLGSGGLYLLALAVGLISFCVAATGTFGVALAHPLLARLELVRRSGTRIEHAIGRTLEIVAVALWVFMALQHFELLGPSSAALRTALDAELRVGELALSLGRVLGFVAVVLVAWATSRVVVFALEADVYPRLQLPRGVPYALSSMVRYGFLLAGFFLALGTLGFDLTRMTVLVSAFGLGIGFGMQQIVNNFISGLILLFERPVQVGDTVQLGDLTGDMLRIGSRSSTLRTSNGAEVIVPNSKLVQEQVTNWTLSDRRRRIDFAIRVPYGSPAGRVLALLLEVAKRDPRVMPHPEPEALFTAFGDTALEFQLRFWTEEARWMRVRSDLGVAVQDALREANIEISWTQPQSLRGPAASEK